ncbi:MAG: sugar transferase [Verrucomicrobia bacterium]|nr:sugar transferase [Verrucomicrobiota bacterium]
MSNRTQKDLFVHDSINKLRFLKQNLVGVLDGPSNVRNVQIQNQKAQAPLPFWKRALDILAIVAALPAILAVSLPLALYIKLVSRGPLFFKQQRVGLNADKFELYKFRSMRCGADTSVHNNHLAELIGSGEKPMNKMDANDSRLIPLGKWVRASGLDELPQLLNVLKGEMSLVGPRPCTVFEFEQYEAWQKERFRAVPGLTGLWQVSGKNQTTFKQMIQLDIAYSRYKCLSMDLAIIVRTVPALIVQLLAARRASQSAARASQIKDASAVALEAKSPSGALTVNEESTQSGGSRMRLLGA